METRPGEKTEALEARPPAEEEAATLVLSPEKVLLVFIMLSFVLVLCIALLIILREHLQWLMLHLSGRAFIHRFDSSYQISNLHLVFESAANIIIRFSSA